MFSWFQRHSTATRWILAGPAAVIGAALIMAAAPIWFPEGAGGVDHLAFPLILFPLFWAAIVFYVLLESRPARAAIVILALVVVNAAIAVPPFIKLATSTSAGRAQPAAAE